MVAQMAITVLILVAGGDYSRGTLAKLESGRTGVQPGRIC